MRFSNRRNQSPSHLRWPLLSILLVLPFAACGANQNHEQRDAAKAEQDEEARDLGALGPEASCIRTCQPDPGSAPVDCGVAEAGVEFMSPRLWDGSKAPYSYSDRSTRFFDKLFEPVQRCGQADNAIHVYGGLFMGWGGGIGESLNQWWNNASTVCNGAPGDMACESPSLDAGLENRTIDASAWDGISFWARRGPEGQDGVRVTLGDKYTDDDLNVDAADAPPDTEQRYCRRSRRCDCPSNVPCTQTEYMLPNNPTPVPKMVCWDPAYPNEKPAYADEESWCGRSMCERNYASGGPDPVFNGEECLPWQRATGDTASFCFDPNSTFLPPEGYEECGDHWQTPVRLSLDWQFFKVPFSTLRQQGFGKASARLHTDQISMLRFTWDGGWVDFYVDDVRFYREVR